jgi:hypothetical protein
VRPMNAEEVGALFRKMRAYRLIFWAYTLSGVLYLFAVLGMPNQPTAGHLPFGDIALGYGVLCLVAIALGKWLAFRPSAFRARRLTELGPASSYVFLTLAFFLAAGESMGMAAVTAASFGAGPPWKLAMLCVWQLAASVLLWPDRGQWDRLLERWASSLPDRGRGAGESAP